MYIVNNSILKFPLRNYYIPTLGTYILFKTKTFLMKNHLLAIAILCLFSISAFAQIETISLYPEKIKELQAKIRSNDPKAIELPFICGQKLSLTLKPHNSFSGKIKDQFPNHHNYRVSSVEDPQISGFLLDSPTGIFYNLNTSEGFVSFRPTKKKNTYQLERGFSDVLADHICEVEEGIKHEHGAESRRVDVPFSHGEILRIYRMAMIVTGEFYENNGNNDDDVLSVVQETLNGLNAIFQKELAINFEVGNRLLFYTDRENDPFLPDQAGGASRPEQASTVINDNFEDDEFDIGHILHNTFDSDDWSGGGIASLRGLCRSNKAAAWSGSRRNTGNSWIQLFSHEVGHQLGASHTFNGTGSNCTSAISLNNAYEIASGTSIMSYRGICDAIYNIPYSADVDNYFHINSLNAMIDHVNDAGNCNTIFETNNIPPDLDINPCNVDSYRIPKNTPFKLRANATDLNGDVISYAWEQYDEDGVDEKPTQGFIGDEAANSTLAPLFRNYAPTTNPERIIPPIADILSGIQNPFEVLPAVERNITMRLTARDNFEGGGTISVDEINISVEDGPLEFVSPSATNNLYEAGNSMLIEWNANGSESLCDNVDIYISSDGGFTFNTPIAEEVPFSNGNYTWDIPGGLQGSANNRIRIECADYSCFSFFIISDEFEINSDCEGNAHFICNADDLLAQEGSALLNLELESVIGQKALGVNVSIDDNDPSQVFIRTALTGACQIPTFPSGNPVFTNHEVRNFTVESTGVYTFRRLSSGFYSIFNTDLISSSDPCAGFLGSNASEAASNPGTVTTSSSSTVSVQLEACENYSILFTTFQTPLDMAVDASGAEIIQISDLLEGTSFTYVVVDIQSDKEEVVYISETADLQDIDQGFYEVYGVQYQDQYDPETWIGLSFSEILIKGDCFISGSNSKEVTVLDDGIDPCDGFFILTDSTPSDCVEPNGTASVQITEGNAPFVIQWSNGMTAATISGLTAGTYMVTVLDAENCVKEAQVQVGLAAPLAVGILENGGMLIAQVSNGSNMYTYEWIINNSPSMVTTENIALQESGTYIVVVTDLDSGCMNSATFEYNNPCSGLMIESSFNNPSCFGSNDGNIVIETTGGEAPYSFDWNGLGTTNSLTDLEAGLYTVVVTDGANCSAQSSFELTSPDEIVLTLESTNESNLGAMDGSATVSVTGGTEPYTYEWSNGTNTDNITNLEVGEYCVSVTDANDCIAEACIEIEAGADPCTDFTIEVESNDATCFDISDGTAMVTTTGGLEPFEYFWSHSVSGQMVENLAPGDYEVTVIDANNCEAIESIEITQPTELELALEKENESTLNAADGSAETIVGGGTEPYTYEWSNAAVTASIDMLEPGQYCVTITDANDCTIQDCITVIEGTNPCSDFTLEFVSSDISCFDFANGTAIANPSGGMEPYTYEWSNGETSMAVNDLVAGLYQVTVLDANNCELIEIFEIAEPEELDLQLSATNETILNGSDGTATADANGGSGDFIYLWSNDETTASISMLAPGLYCVTATDQGLDCDVEDCIRVEAGADPCVDFELLISTENVTCFGSEDGTAVAESTDGMAPYTYEWSNGSTEISNSGLAAGIYSVTVTDANDCTATEEVEILEADELIVKVETTDESSLMSNDGSAMATASGGMGDYSYEWSNGETIQSFIDLAAGEYCVTVTDMLGCTAEACGEVLPGDDPCADFIIVPIVTQATCFGFEDGSVVIETSAGTEPFTFEWSHDVSGQTVSDLAAGTYTVTVTDANDCVLIDEIEIGQNEELVLEINTTNESSLMAADGTATAVVSSDSEPYTFVWSNGETTESISALSPGEYCVTVTDEASCTVEACIEILAGEDLCGDFSISAGIELSSCFGLDEGAALVEITGGAEPFTIEWSNGESEQVILDLPIGIYSVTVTDANDCVLTDEVEIIQNEELLLEITIINESALMSADGAAVAIVSGGTAPYTYLWSNGNNTPELSGLDVGEYCVTITDNLGCTTEACGEVLAGDDACADFSINVSAENAPCFGLDGGAAVVEVNGGLEPFTYEWSNGETDQLIADLAIGTYSVTVIDANDCILIDELEITQSEELIIEITTLDESALMAADGSAKAMVSGGTEPYTYEWSNGNDTDEIINLDAGEYCVTITDNFGCSIEACGEVLAGDDLCADFSIGVSAENAPCFGFDDGAAVVEVTGGTEPFTFAWSNGESEQLILGLAIGVYTVTVTDANDCLLTDEVEITQSEELLLEIVTINESSLMSADGSANVMVSGGSEPYTYVWSNGDVTEEINNLGADEYCVTVTDNFGCTAEACGEILAGDNPCVGFELSISGTDVNCFGGTDGSAAVSATGGTEPYTYAWSNGQNMASASDLIAGNYTATVTDANGCSAASTIDIQQAAAISFTPIIQSNETSAGANDGQISIAVNGGSLPYSFEWSNGETEGNIVGLSAGSYTVTIIDGNDCMAEETFTISTDGTSSGMATVQFIHAAMDETVSIDSDQGMILPYFANTMTTAPMEVPAGQNMQLTLTPLNFWSNSGPANVTASFEAGKTYVAIFYGTFDESDNYPVGIAIKEHNFGTFGNNEVFFDFFHGAHETPSLSLTNNNDLELGQTAYGSFATTTDLANVAKAFKLDLHDADVEELINSYWADFTWWKTRSAVLFTQGTLSEKGGLELWVALADGGAYRLNGYYFVGGRRIGTTGADATEGDRLSIAPNPAKQTPNVKLELMERSDVDMLIYHSSGKLVYRNSFADLGEGIHDLTPLNLNLGTGNYFVELKTNRGKHLVPVIIVE